MLPALPSELVAVLDALPDGHGLYVAERDSSGRVVALCGLYMNPAGLALRGMTLEHMVGSDLLARTRALGNETVAAGYVAALSGGPALQRTLVTDDLAGVRSFEVTAAPLELGGIEVLSMAFRDVTQELRSRRRMQRAVELSEVHSRTDELTGLLNRRGWQGAVDRAFADPDIPLALVIADLDRFKSYNDEHGHLAGDALLVELSAGWAALVEPPRYLARLGGEEFALLLPGLEAPAAAEVMQSLCLAVPAGQTVSMGVASRRDGESPSEVLGRADEALYVAKRGGRARVVVAP